MKIMLIIAVIFSLMFAQGCADKKPAEPGVVDYVTGSAQLKQYQKTRTKIEGINKTLEDRYKAVE